MLAMRGSSSVLSASPQLGKAANSHARLYASHSMFLPHDMIHSVTGMWAMGSKYRLPTATVLICERCMMFSNFFPTL